MTQDIFRWDHTPKQASWEANESIKDYKKTMQNRIVSYIEGLGTEGATCDEVEEALSLSHQTASARISEMKNPSVGILENSKRRRKTRSGRGATVWVVKSRTLYQILGGGQ